MLRGPPGRGTRRAFSSSVGLFLGIGLILLVSATKLPFDFWDHSQKFFPHPNDRNIPAPSRLIQGISAETVKALSCIGDA
jgi:hypothetical protein